MPLLKIAGGTVYDPANNIDGVVMDLWVRDGKIIAPPVADAPGSLDKVIDATNLVVMAGGVDMHAHIAGPKVNLARKMRPEDKRKAPVVRRTPLTRAGRYTASTCGITNGRPVSGSDWREPTRTASRPTTTPGR